jgi:hypothetical protein
MNVIIITVLVVIILLMIYLASIYFSLDYLIREPKSLNVGRGKSVSGGDTTDSAMSVIEHGALDLPASTKYYYAGWFKIDNNTTITGKENVLFNRGTDFIVSLKGSTLNITVNAGNPTNSGDAYKASVQQNAGMAVGTMMLGTEGKSIASIPNFPFQKWTYLVINVDVYVVDVYIDGKFVLSVKNKNNNPIATTATTNLTYGNQYTQGQLTRFSRPARNISPQGVWSNYMKGSGQNMSFSSTSLGLQITKNGQKQIDQKLI